ncbi:putative invertase inhibitor [Tasmannia lanceolata]|uniref:putative invertase inhibitor n=1 Tax=Tasmannia lanceolata TaxID=3420 RepID=UPI004064A019
MAQIDPQLGYDFCVTSLETDSRSYTTDLQGLGVISVELAITRASITISYIKDLMKNTTSDPFIKERLRSCLDQYSNAIPTLENSSMAFKSKRYEDVNIWVSAAMDGATTCEDGFNEEEGHVSPLTKENGELFQLGAIALAVTHLL